MELVDETPAVFDLTNMRVSLAITVTCYAAFHQLREHTQVHPEVYIARTEGEGQHMRLMELDHLLQLSGWSVSEETLRNSAESDPFSSRLEHLHDESYRTEDLPESRRLQQFARMVGGTYEYLTASLPIEAGRNRLNPEQEFRDEVQEDVDRLNPILHGIIEDVRHELGALTPDSLPEEKEETKLNDQELRRQIRAVRTLSETGNVLPGFVLARELLVNGAMLGTKETIPGKIWLDGDERSDAAAPFYLLNHWMQYQDLRGLLSNSQKRVARLWGSVKQRRNELAHAGFCRDTVRYRRLKEELQEKIEEIRDLVLNERTLLSSLLQFGFSGHSVFFPMGTGMTSSERLLRLVLSDHSSVTDVYLFVASGSAIGDSLEACGDMLKERGISGETIHVPPGDRSVQDVDIAWEQRRTELLQNRMVSAVMTGSSPVLDHVVRQIYQNVCQFGIPANLLAVQEASASEGANKSRFQQVILDRFDPSSRGRSR